MSIDVKQNRKGSRAPADRRILVVDDEPQVLGLMRTILERHGFIVMGTTSGREALARLADGSVELLLLDLSMPEPDGFEILKTVRTKYPEMKVIIFSGAMGGALLDMAPLFGAAGVLRKPIDEDVLISTIERVLEGTKTNGRFVDH